MILSYCLITDKLKTPYIISLQTTTDTSVEIVNGNSGNEAIIDGGELEEVKWAGSLLKVPEELIENTERRPKQEPSASSLPRAANDGRLPIPSFDPQNQIFVSELSNPENAVIDI